MFLMGRISPQINDYPFCFIQRFAYSRIVFERSQIQIGYGISQISVIVVLFKSQRINIENGSGRAYNVPDRSVPSETDVDRFIVR